MKISVIRAHDDVLSVDLQADSIKAVLSGLKFHFGQSITDSLLNEQYKYVLMNGDDPDSAVALHPEVIGSSFDAYDTLVIVRDIDGSVPVAVVAGWMGVAATSFAAIAVTAIINIAISIAINVVMQALSPTPEFSSDPSQAQNKQSALFNGAPMIREQGGIVPWILGAPYCGGVLISSGISTEDF